jgi:hypothetical protein
MPTVESLAPDSPSSSKIKHENRSKNTAKGRRILQNKRDNGSDENDHEDNEDGDDNVNINGNSNTISRKDKGKGRAQIDEDMSDEDDEGQNVRNRKRIKDLNGHARRPSEVVGSDQEVQETIDYDMLANKIFERDSKDG